MLPLQAANPNGLCRVGPRKLSKMLVFAMNKWKETQNVGQIARQPTMPMRRDDAQNSSTPTEVQVFFADRLGEISPAAREDASTPLAIPHRTLVPPAVGNENAEGSSTAVPTAMSTDRQDSSHTAGDPEVTADFLLVDDSEINLKVCPLKPSGLLPLVGF